MTEKVSIAGRRLGRLPTPPQKRKRNLKLGNYLLKLKSPPAYNVAPTIGTWPMYANDHYGDCTCAAAGHLLEVWTQQVDGQPHLLTDGDILNLYNLVNGGVDQGADMLTVLGTWRHQGLAGDPILAYAEVDVSKKALLRAGCFMFGGLYIGIELPVSCQAQIGGTWDVPPGGAHGDGEPGSWGGHCVNVVAYDRHGLTVITWGAPQRMTWRFWKAYCDEAYVAIPTDYDRLAGKPLANGFNEDALKADLAQFGPVNAGG